MHSSRQGATACAVGENEVGDAERGLGGADEAILRVCSQRLDERDVGSEIGVAGNAAETGRARTIPFHQIQRERLLIVAEGQRHDRRARVELSSAGRALPV